MLEELDADYVVFNGSLNVDKDSLRTEIKVFASNVSLLGKGRKYILIDEADYLSSNHVQPALRQFMEEYSDNVGFILTCNYKNKIIPPLHSRCSVIDFVIPSKLMPEIAKLQFKRMRSILDQEHIKYDIHSVVGVIKHFFPDMRRMINELQRYSAAGVIDSGILASFTETTVEELFRLMKDKNFTGVRKWVTENQDVDANELFRVMYDLASQHCAPQTLPYLVVILAKYQYQHSFVADPSINTCACLVEIMGNVEFK